jgi:hypothetical protein
MPTDPPTANSAKPRPGLPKTIGLLNLAFGGMFFFCGLAFLKEWGPALDQYYPEQLDAVTAQQWYTELRKMLVADLMAQEKDAPTAADRAALRAERLALEAKKPRIADQIDLTAYNLGVRWLTWYLWADIVTAPVLNLLVLASGIGLVQLRDWARRMGIWVAVALIVRQFVLTVFLIFFVIPRAEPMVRPFLESDLGKVWLAANKVVKNPNRPTGTHLKTVDPQEFATVFPGVSTFMALAWLGISVIYPSIALAVLNHPSSRAACVAAEEAEAEAEDESSW